MPYLNHSYAHAEAILPAPIDEDRAFNVRIDLPGRPSILARCKPARTG